MQKYIFYISVLSKDLFFSHYKKKSEKPRKQKIRKTKCRQNLS